MKTRVDRLREYLVGMQEIRTGLDAELGEMIVGTWSNVVGARYSLQKSIIYLKSVIDRLSEEAELE